MIHDDKLYSGSKDYTIRVWSLKDGECHQTLTGHTSWVNGLAAGTDSTLYSASGDRTVRVWSIVDGSNLETLTGHTASVRCLVANRTNLVFSGSKDKTIKVWRRGPTPTTCIRTLVGHTDVVESLALSADHNTLYSGSWDTTIRVWSNHTHVKTLSVHTGCVVSLAVGQDGTLVSGSHDGTVRVWSADDFRPIRTFDGTKVKAVAVGMDGSIVSLRATGEVWYYTFRSDHGTKLYNVVQSDFNTDSAMAFGPGGALYVGSNEILHIF